MTDKKLINVACDDGYAETKVVLEDGTCFKYPSLIKSGVVLGKQSDLIHTYITKSENAQDQKYTATSKSDGEAANTRFNSYPTSPENRVMIHHALRRSGVGDAEVNIATSLPVSEYYFNDGPNKALIEQKTVNVMIPVVSSINDKCASIVSSKVYPESVSAWIDFLLDENGDYRINSTKPSVIIDIGGRTTDTAKILDGLTLQRSSSGTENIGVLDIFDELAKLVCKNEQMYKKFNAIKPSEFTRAALSEILENGYYQYKDVKIQLEEEVSLSKQNVVSRIIRDVEGRIGSGFGLDYILFVGGGAAVLKNELLSHYSYGVVVDEPEFANARGMMKALKFV